MDVLFFEGQQTLERVVETTVVRDRLSQSLTTRPHSGGTSPALAPRAKLCALPMLALSATDAAQLASNVRNLFYALPSAVPGHHSAWSKELVGLLLCNLSSSGQQMLCKLAPETVAAYVRNFDPATSRLLHQHYPTDVRRAPSTSKEEDVRAHLHAVYEASRSGDKKVLVSVGPVSPCD